MLSIVVLLSGTGTNLQAIIDAIKASKWPVAISAVISNKLGAAGLLKAQNAHIPTHSLEAGTLSRVDYDQQLHQLIAPYQPDLIVLAGFMRILSPEFVVNYTGKIINIHPSLLPKYPGLHTYQQVLAAGDRYHGSTVHFVTEALDEGPIIAQAAFPVTPHDTLASLKVRTLEIEHQLYPWVIYQYAMGTVQSPECSSNR